MQPLTLLLHTFELQPTFLCKLGEILLPTAKIQIFTYDKSEQKDYFHVEPVNLMFSRRTCKESRRCQIVDLVFLKTELVENEEIVDSTQFPPLIFTFNRKNLNFDTFKAAGQFKC